MPSDLGKFDRLRSTVEQPAAGEPPRDEFDCGGTGVLPEWWGDGPESCPESGCNSTTCPKRRRWRSCPDCKGTGGFDVHSDAGKLRAVCATCDGEGGHRLTDAEVRADAERLRRLRNG